MKPVELHPEAEGDASVAFEWYSSRSDRAAGALVVELDRAIDLIARSPSSFPQHDGTCRRYVLRRFPFLILYREQADRIQVLAVAHGRRRPEYWLDRR